MRTTLDIEEDVLQAARELARREGGTTGEMISSLARRGLANPAAKDLKNKRKSVVLRGGVPLLASRREVVTLEHVQNLMDHEGI